MFGYLAKRLATTALLALGVLLLTFLLARVLPGDPARLVAGPRASAETVAAVREELGLNDSLAVQLYEYGRRVFEGDFGRSVSTRRPVLDDILQFFPATLELVLASVLIGIAVGFLSGSLAAIRSNGVTDVSGRFCSALGLSLPDFWLALLAQLVFAWGLGWLPFAGRLPTGATPPPEVTGFMTVDSLIAGDLALFAAAATHLLLPAVVLAIPTSALLFRMVRATMLGVLSKPFMLTARSKGLSPYRIYLRHALRNVLPPTITLLGLNFGFLIGGAVFVELVFQWPGLGRYTAAAISSTDYNAIMAITLIVSLCYMLINLAVDLIYTRLDPRITLK